MALTVATRMTAGAATIGERACLQDLVDVVDSRWAVDAAIVAVVDDFGRLLGAVEAADHPDLFGCTAGSRVAGTPRHRRRRAGQRLAVAGDLMTAALAVPETWPVARASRALIAAGVDAAFVVDDLGVVRGTLTIRQCQPAPAVRTAPKEAGRDQVRV
ncbi:CBS domain-containing protein [Dactylosporangium cerinum]|uniref:CBS domain-containing protein n=1 Tax=Dactylosporangium cerinum TaxID=1434730 RepID=A0ABV9VV24_9ACTN